LAGVYKPGDFIMTEEVHHARACKAPTLGVMYGTPDWQGLSNRTPGRWKFLKAHLDLDKIWDYAWCELEEKSQRCKMDKHGIIWNGGTVLSFFGCERRENKKGTGTARLMDAPLAYLDAVNDATCSCTYPRCFGGALRSRYEVANALGEGLKLDTLFQVLDAKVKQALFPLLRAKLEKCCAFKTAAFISGASKACGEKHIENVCKAVSNGYEPRFGGEGLGARKHFPKSPCVAEEWSRLEMMAVIDKRTFPAGQAAKLAKNSPLSNDAELERSSLAAMDVDLEDTLAGENSARQGWATSDTPTPSHSPVSNGAADGNTCLF